MRVLVTGSRHWPDEAAVWRELDALLAEHGQITVVHGACPTGADAAAHHWVAEAGDAPVVEEQHPADWGRYGPAAGPRRNREMVQLGANVCLAFPTVNSVGTVHCLRLAEAAGIEVHRYTLAGGAAC